MAYFQTQNPKVGRKIWEGLAMEDSGIFYGHLVYCMTIWSILTFMYIVYYVTIWSIL
jgi:hypothetical protein